MSFIFMHRTLAGPAARVKRNAPARLLWTAMKMKTIIS
jgi:hypothetical protein